MREGRLDLLDPPAALDRDRERVRAYPFGEIDSRSRERHPDERFPQPEAGQRDALQVVSWAPGVQGWPDRA
jgi:hypothetical protein